MTVLSESIGAISAWTVVSHYPVHDSQLLERAADLHAATRRGCAGGRKGWGIKHWPPKHAVYGGSGPPATRVSA